MPKLDIIIASTRPVRVGEPIAEWFAERARAHGKFEIEVVDLKEVDLPLLDEIKHPRLAEYEHAHTKRWSASVAAADAFVFVTPEYNHGTPPALVNALDYLYREWNYKPAGFVSYGGVSAGTRAAQMTKQILTTLKVVPLVEAVAIPFFTSHMSADGKFNGTDAFDQSAKVMLDELLRWSDALTPLRRQG
jgi:NAD(P)H-dependent FMN reductase